MSNVYLSGEKPATEILSARLPKLYLDFETLSVADIKKVGADAYARHPSTDVMCMGFAFDDDQVWVIPRANLHGLDTKEVRSHVAAGGTVVAQNAAFELAIWNYVLVPRYGFPPLKPEQVICTMVKCYAMALPGALEKAAAALGIADGKDMGGNRVMLQLSQPRTGPDESCTWCSGTGKAHANVTQWSCRCTSWYNEEEFPEKFQQLYRYCAKDIEVEREVDRRTMNLSAQEKRVWLVDQKINQRGVAIDLHTVRRAMVLADEENARLNLEMREATDGAVATFTATGQLTDWLKVKGVPAESVAKADVIELLEDPALPQDCRKALLIRQEGAKTSTRKLATMLTGVCDDGRARGLFQYNGAQATRRWAGRRLQTQNFPRPTMKQAEIEEALDAISRGASAAEISLFHGPALTVLANCLRGLLHAADGHELLAADLANIEGRGVAWLAGEEWKLQAFRDYDAKRGPDLYKVAANGVFGCPVDDVTDEQRQVGKVVELSGGFGGGVGALQSMAKNYNVKLAPAFPALWALATDRQKKLAEEAWLRESKKKDTTISREEFLASDITKQRWREQHPAIVDYWKTLEEAAIRAVLNPGHVVEAGPAGRAVKYRMSGSFLLCQLPSKGVICYPYPQVKQVKTPWGTEKDTLSYMGEDSTTRKWMRFHAYGGLLCENVTQSLCRDILAESLLELEARGYPVVLHSHDEAVAERRVGEGSLAEMEKIMSRTPAWAAGLPVVAKGWRNRRYKK